MANVGSVDRILRFIVGALLVGGLFVPQLAAYMPASPWNWVLGAVGVVMLLTAIFRYCPAYPLLGMNTCKRS